MDSSFEIYELNEVNRALTFVIKDQATEIGALKAQTYLLRDEVENLKKQIEFVTTLETPGHSTTGYVSATPKQWGDITKDDSIS